MQYELNFTEPEGQPAPRRVPESLVRSKTKTLEAAPAGRWFSYTELPLSEWPRLYVVHILCEDDALEKRLSPEIDRSIPLLFYGSEELWQFRIPEN